MAYIEMQQFSFVTTTMFSNGATECCQSVVEELNANQELSFDEYEENVVSQ